MCSVLDQNIVEQVVDELCVVIYLGEFVLGEWLVEWKFVDCFGVSYILVWEVLI